MEKKKGSVMKPTFYIWIKSIQTTSWKKKKSIHMAGHVHKEAVTSMPMVKTLMWFNYVSKDWKKDFIFYDYFSIRHQSLQQVNGNTPTGFICSNKTENYAAKHVSCVANKFLYTLQKHFFGGANKFLYCVSNEIGEVFHMHQLYYGCILAYYSDDPNGPVLLIQVPSTWENTMRQFAGMKYGPLQFINIKDTRIKSIQMTTSPERSIQTTGLHKETMDTVAVSGYMDEFPSMFYRCLSKVIGGVFHRQQFSLKKPMNKRSVSAYMDLLPKEVIQEEVLIRLPVKTLMRLNCVSKDWNDFISDDLFRRRYRSLQQANGNTPIGFICGDKIDDYAADHGFCMANKFLYTSENYVKKKELECFDYLNTFGYVIAASKGLLLVGHNLNTLSVYDLVSKRHVNLPRNNLEGGDLVSLGFKCEESNSSNHHLCYKVVCVDNPGKDHYQKRSSHSVEIYSSETGVWQKSIMKSKSLPFLIRSQHIAKVIRGVFYWHEKDSNSFIAYDSEDPEGRVVFIELPNIRNILYRRKMRQLEGMKDGSLQFVSRDLNESVLKVWILQSNSGRSRNGYMDEDIVVASRWVLAHSVSLCDIGVGFSGLCDTFKMTSRIIGVDPVDPHIIYLCIDDQLYAYDCRQGKVAFTLSPKMELQTDVFVHFEWPTWACL